jgi:hypothetical protein
MACESARQEEVGRLLFIEFCGHSVSVCVFNNLAFPAVAASLGVGTRQTRVSAPQETEISRRLQEFGVSTQPAESRLRARLRACAISCASIVCGGGALCRSYQLDGTVRIESTPLILMLATVLPFRIP